MGAAAVVLIVTIAAVVLVVQLRRDRIMASDVLTAQGSTSGEFWESDADAALETVTEAEFGVQIGQVVRSVPMRKGEAQGVVLVVTNRSDYQVDFRGTAVPDFYTAQISTAPMDGAPPFEEFEFADSSSIGAGEARYLLIRSTPRATCAGYSAGSGLGMSDVRVRVEVDGVARTVEVSGSDMMLLTSTEDENPAGCPV